jgi:hypothetical protein
MLLADSWVRAHVWNLESLRERWRSTAEEIGLDRDAIRLTFGRDDAGGPERLDATAVEEALTARAFALRPPRRDPGRRRPAPCGGTGRRGRKTMGIYDHFIPSGFEVDQLNAAVEREMRGGRESEPESVAMPE